MGQASAAELAKKDLKAELQQREQQHYGKIEQDKVRAGLIPFAGTLRSVPCHTSSGGSRIYTGSFSSLSILFVW